MEFDEYDYLEKMVENTDPQKLKEAANGGEETLKSEKKERTRSSKHKIDENDNDLDHRAKRSKSRGESRDRDLERASSRHRSSPRDGEKIDRDRHRSRRDHRDKDRDRDREERNGKDKDRERDREERNVKDRTRERDREERNGKDRTRERDREERNGKDKDRERDRARDKDKGKDQDRDIDRDKERDCDRDKREHKPDNEREKDKEQERSRRSISRPEMHRDEQVREKSWDGEFKEREREKEFRERDRENRRYKEKKEEVAEPEVDPERDQRTVFAYQISLKADERDVYDFFSRAGKVRDVRLIMDRNSRRSRGVGYIEFFDSMSVPMAIALSGQLLVGQPVMVKPSEAEKNLVQSTTSAAGVAGGLIGPYSGGARRLYVGNLHFNIKEDQLRQVFESFGNVELVQLPTDPETGNSKGFGFVQFARLEDARAAQSLNGQLEIAGQIIKVSAITDQVGMQDVGVNAGDFDDDDEGSGLALNARSRALLMQKLDRSGTASSIAGSPSTTVANSPGFALPTASILGATPAVPPLISPLVQASVPVLAGLPSSGLSVPTVTVPSFDTIGVPSECLLLKNMFDPTLEVEPDFDLDIKEDVGDECSKFGTLKHIYVDKNSAGFVYLRFENTQAAINAQRALHGRWFAGKMITATFMVPQNYEAKFPDSR
ncbi:RNA-binding protein 39-like [Camellia sinensis]|uniref:RNA-binding protein 39-like n=1 Tax=Camellia sinensis TaxID=4442 RepID=UPI00103554FE|nr:RNA-binding protein 39-like [Camellia sinensis]